MRLLYVDEAGISQKEPFLVVGGVVVHGDSQLIPAENALAAIVKRWIPPEQQHGFVFHATELFNGGGKVFRRHDIVWTLKARLELADQLAALPQMLGLTLAIGVVAKSEVHKPHDFELRKWLVHLHAVAFIGCAAMVEKWIRINYPEEVCLIIAEDNDAARNEIKLMMRRFQDEAFVQAMSSKWELPLPLQSIREDPSFQPKKSSSILQIADFWCYIARKFYERDARYERFWKIMWPCLAPGVFPDRPVPTFWRPGAGAPPPEGAQSSPRRKIS